MRLTVLGMQGPFPGPEGAGSGYYVESSSGVRILMDCGPGVLGRLQRYCRVQDLACVVITHWHADHASDLLAMGYALEQLKRINRASVRLRLIAPPMPAGWRELVSAESFEVLETQDLSKFSFDGLDIELHAMTHTVPCFAVRLTDREGQTLVYSGDTTFNGRLVALALKADLLLCDCGHLQRDFVEGAPHMSAMQAGQTASVATAHALLLTHLSPLYSPKEVLAEAAVHFPEAAVAEELRTYQV